MTRARRLRLVGALIAAGLVAFAGWYYWLRPATPELPVIDTNGFDPEVVKAIDSACQRVEVDPESAQAWGDLGSVLFAHDLYPQSLPCFERAERLDPADARWPYFQALIHIIGESDRALPCLDRAVERAGSEIAPRLRRAEFLHSLEQWDRARADFEYVRQRDPSHARVSLGLGQIALRDGDWEHGVALLKPLIDDPTTQRAARTALAELAARRGDQTKAMAYTAALTEIPRDVPWFDPFMEAVERRKVGLFHRLDLARQLIARRQYAEAEELLNDIIRAHPKSVEAYLRLGELQLIAGEYRNAEIVAQQYLSLEPDDSNGHFVLGAARFQQDDFARAEQSFKKAVDLNPTFGPAHYFVGECRRKLRDPEGAKTKYLDALRYQPNFAEAHIALASIFLEEGDKSRAHEHLQAALEIKPNHPEAKRLIGKVR